MAERAEGPPLTAEEQADAARAAIARLEDQLRRIPRQRAYERAVLRYNLGLAWQEFPAGERALNLSRAVASLVKAAELFDPAEHPIEHARTRNALGAALRESGQLEEAVAAFRTAAELVPADINPGEHGAALNNLGLALSDQGLYDEAAEAFEGALEAFARPDLLRQRLAALHNLGQALVAPGDPAGVERGIAVYRQAIELADPEEHPYQWGLLHHSLGSALTAVRLPHEAVDAFRQALRVFTRSRFPFQYALTKNNLGLAYAQIGSTPALRRAVVCFEDALRVLDVRLHQAQWEQAYRNLGLAEAALAEAGEHGTRPEHFARLLAEAPADEAMGLLRERVQELAALPEPQRTERLAELDLALLGVDDGALERLTGAWLDVLMELPQPGFAAGLRARMVALGHLGEAERARAMSVMDALISDRLLAPQRIRVRDTLNALGYTRPEP